jgi:hypothetical protein
MPRARKLLDQELPGLEDMDPDPTPTAARPTRARTRRTPAKAAGNRGRVAARTPSGRIMSQTAMRNKVREEIGMYLALMQGAWDLRDPICAQAATPERLDTIADRITSMIARSDSLLEMATKSGIIGDIVALLSAAFPIAREVWRAHGPGGIGHQSVEEVQRDYALQYPPHAAAAR